MNTEVLSNNNSKSNLPLIIGAVIFIVIVGIVIFQITKGDSTDDCKSPKKICADGSCNETCPEDAPPGDSDDEDEDDDDADDDSGGTIPPPTGCETKYNKFKSKFTDVGICTNIQQFMTSVKADTKKVLDKLNIFKKHKNNNKDINVTFCDKITNKLLNSLLSSQMIVDEICTKKDFCNINVPLFYAHIKQIIHSVVKDVSEHVSLGDDATIKQIVESLTEKIFNTINKKLVCPACDEACIKCGRDGQLSDDKKFCLVKVDNFNPFCDPKGKTFEYQDTSGVTYVPADTIYGIQTIKDINTNKLLNTSMLDFGDIPTSENVNYQACVKDILADDELEGLIVYDSSSDSVTMSSVKKDGGQYVIKDLVPENQQSGVKFMASYK